MISNNELKYYSSLFQKKFRNEENKFIIEGEKNVLEGINSSYKADIVVVTNEFSEDNPDLTEFLSNRTRLEIIKNSQFNKLSDTVNPQGIAAVFHKPKRSFSAIELKSNLIVILDNISDPGNAGTIMRTCDWFGVKQLILTTGCADVYNPKTLRGSMGSVFHLIIYENIEPEAALSNVSSAGYKIYCSDINGESIYNITFPGKTALIFSNEARGPSEIINKMSDSRITIPGYGKAESLNVAAAVGIILSEVSRNRKSY